MNTKKFVKRPVLLYVLTFIFLMAGIFSLIGTLGIFQSWNWWLSFLPVRSIIFQVFLGVLTTLAFIATAIILWLRLPWAILYCNTVIILSVVWFWVERLFLTQNPLPLRRHILVLVVMCIFLLFLFSSLYLVVPAMKPHEPSRLIEINSSPRPTGDNHEKLTTRN